MDYSARHKVIWSEGLLIGPHHFQQSDRYHEHTLDLRVRPLVTFGWGALDLSIDLSSLEQRSALRLTTFRGVLPSGTVVSIPDADDVPPAREISAELFAIPSGKLDVYLALPVDRPNRPNYRMSGSAAIADDTRYVPAFVSLVDECTGENEQTIVTAKHNVRLLVGNENDTQLERIKIAELLRQPDGRVTLNPDYTPPCLVFRASAYLSRVLRDLARRLNVMVAAVSAARRPADESAVDRLEMLWAHGILSSSLALLNHYNQVQQIHPEQVYRNLLELAGHLRVLLPSGQVVELPPYDHDNLAICFGQLIQSIETLLRAVPAPAHGPLIAIELEQAQSAAGYPVLRTRLPLDTRLLTADYSFYLVGELSGERAERLQALSEHLAGAITVASFKEIDRYIERAYGLRVSLDQRPSEAPLQAPALYFRMEQFGAVWEGIRSDGSLAVNIPRAVWQEFKQLDVTLIAIRQPATRARR